MPRHRVCTLIAVVVMIALSGCATKASLNDDHDCNSDRPKPQCSMSGSKPQTSDKTVSYQSPVDLLTPYASVAGAIDNAPEVMAAKARISVADAEIVKAEAQFKPTVSFDSTASVRAYDHDPSASRNSNAPYSYALSVKVPIYQGGRAKSALSFAEASKRISIERAKDTIVMTAYELALAMVEVQQRRGSLEALKRHEHKLQALQNDVRLERDAGLATAVDTGDVNRQLASLAVDRQQQALALAEAEQTLFRLNLGRSVSLSSISRKVATLPKGEKQLLQLALKNNPKISERLARMDAAQARIDQVRSSYNPSVSLDVSASGRGDEVGFEHSYEARAMLKLSVPLYSGGAKEADIAARSGDLMAAGYDRDGAVMGVRAALRSARNRLVQASRMLAAAEKEYTAASRLQKGIREERKLGERTAFDEIRVIDNMAGAELNKISARASVQKAEVTLAAEAGLLADYLGVSEPFAYQLARLKPGKKSLPHMIDYWRNER